MPFIKRVHVPENIADWPAIAVFKKLLKYVWPYRYLFFLGCLGNLIYAAADSYFIKYFSEIINKGLVARDQAFIASIPIVVVLYFLIRGFGSYVTTYFMGRVGRGVVRDFRVKLLEHFLFLPTAFFQQYPSGELISKANYDTEQVATTISDSLANTIKGVFVTVGYIGVMFWVNWRLTLLLIVVGPILIYYINFVGHFMRRYSKRIQKSMGQLTHLGREITEAHKEIKAFEGQSYEQQRIAQITQYNYRQEMKMIHITAVSVPFMQLIGALAVAMVLYLAMLPVNHVWGTGLSPGDFGTMFMAMLQLMRPIKQIASVNTAIQRGIAAAKSIFIILAVEKEADCGRQYLDTLAGHVAVSQVSFAYENTPEDVLHEINFTVSPGQTIALVGRSGSGKTTMVSLLSRYYTPTAGKIFLDGVDIQSLKLSHLRRQISYVSQHVILFNGTIAENIAYGVNRYASLEDITAAAKAAYALEFIEQLPQGFQTPIGDNGLKLSGGQRQRIAIARAVLKKAPILILDEATASLDSESEQYIQLAFEQLMKNHTTFIVAHRFSTIQKADKILVFEKGRIVQVGDHQSLSQDTKGQYANLSQVQMSLSTE